jgi:hypothetical protein
MERFTSEIKKIKSPYERVAEEAVRKIQSQKPKYYEQYSEDINEIIKTKESEFNAAWKKEVLEGRIDEDPVEDEKMKALVLLDMIRTILDEKNKSN